MAGRGTDPAMAVPIHVGASSSVREESLGCFSWADQVINRTGCVSMKLLLVKESFYRGSPQ